MATRKSKGPPRKKISTPKKVSPSEPRKIWNLYVGYPPQNLEGKEIYEKDVPTLPNTYVTEYSLQKKGDLESLHGFWSGDIVFTLEEAEAIRSPLLALIHLVQADSLMVYPLPPIQAFVANGIRKYLESEGNKSLEECLRLVGKPGTPNQFSRWKKFNRDLWLRQAMILLRKTFKFSIEEAAGLVSKLPNSLKPNTLEHRFKNNKTWIAHRKVLEPAEWLQLKTLEAQQKFLKKFPYGSLPKRLKPLHPEHPI